jgi:hypothetical protein
MIKQNYTTQRQNNKTFRIVPKSQKFKYLARPFAEKSPFSALTGYS